MGKPDWSTGLEEIQKVLHRNYEHLQFGLQLLSSDEAAGKFH